MIKIFRLSAFLAVVVIITRTGLWVADDIVIGNEKSGDFIHTISRLFQEASRRQEELDHAASGILAMAEAISATAARAIHWMARGLGALGRSTKASRKAVVGTVRGALAGNTRSVTKPTWAGFRKGILALVCEGHYRSPHHA